MKFAQQGQNIAYVETISEDCDQCVNISSTIALIYSLPSNFSHTKVYNNFLRISLKILERLPSFFQNQY